jgi:sec-independent protein translocase protein TatC
VENKPAYDEIVANLQKRVWIYAVIAISTFVAAFNFSEQLTEWLGDKLLPDDATLVYLSPAEFLILKMRIAGYAALSVSFILVMIDCWATMRSRSALPDIGFGKIITILIISLGLFTAGALYSLELMLPLVLDFLQSDAADAGLDTTYRLTSFYHFVFLLTFALGISFQLPLIVMLLLKLELATTEKLSEFRSHLIVTFFVLAAMITPPDVISQFLLAVPLIILYELSIIIGKIA